MLDGKVLFLVNASRRVQLFTYCGTDFQVHASVGFYSRKRECSNHLPWLSVENIAGSLEPERNNFEIRLLSVVGF